MSSSAQTVAEYIRGCPVATQGILVKVLSAIRETAPAATELISYNMPTFVVGGRKLHVGAFKNHIGIFPPIREGALQERLKPYQGEKGNLRFPIDKPVPYELIREIACVFWSSVRL